MLLVEEAHFAKKITWVEVGENNLFAVAIVFNHHRDRTLNNVIQGISMVTGIDNGAFRRIAASVAVG